MFLDRTDMLILEELSKNSRCLLKDIAARANVSIQTISSRLERLEKSLGLKYTLELDLQKAGCPQQFFIRVNFRENSRPDPNSLRNLLSKNPFIQFAALTKGDFDLFLWSVAPSAEDYEQAVNGSLRSELDECISDWTAHPLMARRAGFLPVGNDLIDSLRLPESRRRTLRVLNDNARIMVTKLAEELGVKEPTAEYHLKRAKPFISRFTSYFQTTGEFLHMVRFLQLRGKERDFQSEGRKVSDLYLKSDPRLFNRLVYAGVPSGGMDRLFIETYSSLEDYEAHSEGIKACSSIIGKHSAAKVEKILKGAIPIRKVDILSECKYLLSPAETGGE